MTWVLVYNRTRDGLTFSDGHDVPPAEFTYADDTDPMVQAHIAAGRLVSKTIDFDPATATGIDPEARQAAAEVISRNGGAWTPPPAPPHQWTIEEVRDLLNTGRLSKTAMMHYVSRDLMTGPNATDITSVTAGAAADAALNEQYSISGNTLPAIWPIDAFGNFSIASNLWSAKTSQSTVATVSTMRFMCDGQDFAAFTYAAPFYADIFIDGRPYANNPVALVATAGYGSYGFLRLAFPDARPRLIEIRTIGGCVAAYCKKPYRIWKPAPDPNPKIAVVGDSYVAPTVMNDAASGQVSAGGYLRGLYQRMPAQLGLTSLVTDGIGGTGYIAGGGPSMPYNHINRLNWLSTLKPDVVVVHGGGVNDIYNSNTVSATVAAAVAYFKSVRDILPDAKLVFVEGFTPPTFTPATYGPLLKSIREQVQAALTLKNMYYLDVQTTRPPLAGSGYVTAPNSSGNSDIYVGSDGAHLTIKGNQFARHILAPKLRRVLMDDGRLDGQLIL